MIIILEKAKALYSHIHENVFKIMFFRTGSTLTFTFIIVMIFILVIITITIIIIIITSLITIVIIFCFPRFYLLISELIRPEGRPFGKFPTLGCCELKE